MHQHHADHDSVQFTQEFWDDRYSSAGRLWSGNPNGQLVAQTAGLVPGAALDAGCGEGADAIWLASQGWTVTAVDVSEVALARGAGQASAQGGALAARISWQRQDLLSWVPPARQFDLVSAHYMYLPGPDFAALQRRLAAAVRPGGTLLVVGHDHDDLVAARGSCPWGDMFRSPRQLADALDSAEWEIIVAAGFERPAPDPGGNPIAVKDVVLRAMRRR